MLCADSVTKIALDIAEYTDSRVCTDCGGECCKSHAGLYYPADLEPLAAESLAARFRSGLYAIDWWEGDPRDEHDEYGRVDFIRPRHEGVERLRDPSWGGRCVRLTDTGCDLPFHERPTQCRALKPCCCKDLKPCSDGGCEDTVSKRDTALAWMPYQQLIADAELLLDNKPGAS